MISIDLIINTRVELEYDLKMDNNYIWWVFIETLDDFDDMEMTYII